MPRNCPIQTPLGRFDSAKAAAAAHGITSTNIQYRLKTHPDQYRRLMSESAPARPKLDKRPDQVTIHDWPLAWTQYTCLSAEQREQLYTQWLGGRDPESEAMVTEFFAEMDRVGVAATEDPEAAVEETDDQADLIPGDLQEAD